MGEVIRPDFRGKTRGMIGGASGQSLPPLIEVVYPVGEAAGIGVYLAHHPNRKDDLLEVVVGPASCSECEVVATLPTTRAGKTEAIRISRAILRTLELIGSINKRPPA